MKRPRAQDVASLAMNDADDMSSFSSASTYCSPRRRRKHQRTMEDAFRSFTIGKLKPVLPLKDDFVATGNNNNNVTMMNEDIVEDDEESSGSSLEDELLLTDQEREERKVMFELVFGKSHESIVEAKLQEWIQRTAREVSSSTYRQQGVCQDDMNLPPACNSNGMKEAVGYGVFANDSSRTRFRSRSNSLPTDLSGVNGAATDEMVVEDIGDNDGMEL